MAKARSNKISLADKERFEKTLAATIPSETSLETTHDINKDSIDIVENDETTITAMNSGEELQRQLDEANQRFLDVSGKLHELEAENSRLNAENNVLKQRCLELETMKSSLENELFSSNVELSEKLSKITDLTESLEMLKKNMPNGYTIKGILNKNTSAPSLNGYESWN